MYLFIITVYLFSYSYYCCGYIYILVNYLFYLKRYCMYVYDVCKHISSNFCQPSKRNKTDREDGGYNGAHYFPYNFALSLLFFTTNVVVLCEYLSQKFPLWGIIKDYCIVLYCIVLYILIQ